MGNIILSIVMGWALERVNIIINAMVPPALQNENAGYGAIEDTISRRTLAPACYRVLLPWIFGLYKKIFPKSENIIVYQAIRTLMMMFMFWSIMQGWSPLVAGITGVILCLTIRYDYWDWPIELAGIALAMSGHFELAIIGGILSALSRETAPMVAGVYLLQSGDWYGSCILLGIIVLIMLSVRLYVGRRALHCKRIVLKTNWKGLQTMLKWRPFWNADTFIMFGLSLFGIATLFASSITGWFVVLLTLVTSWIFAKHDEARVLVTIVPFIAAFLARI